MPLRSPMPCRSTRCSGVASRSFIIGTRLCPPASGRASSPSDRQQFDRIGHRCGPVIAERAGNHGLSSPFKSLSMDIGREVRAARFLPARRRAMTGSQEQEIRTRCGAARTNCVREPDLSTSSRRTPGPITTVFVVAHRRRDAVIQFGRRCVWVPEFAGTTWRKGSANAPAHPAAAPALPSPRRFSRGSPARGAASGRRARSPRRRLPCARR